MIVYIIVNNDSLYNSQIVMTSISVSCLIALARTSRIMLSISSYNEHLGLITGFGMNASDVFIIKHYATY